jgi:hypothetical protein
MPVLITTGGAIESCAEEAAARARRLGKSETAAADMVRDGRRNIRERGRRP